MLIVFSSSGDDLQANEQIYIKRFIIKYWFMHLWRLRSSKICSQQIGDPGEQMVYLKSEFKRLRTRRAQGLKMQEELMLPISTKGRKRPKLQLKTVEVLSHSALLSFHGL